MARTGIFGRSGVGKSWMFGWYLERAVPEFEYAVHFDKEDEEQGLSRKEDSLFKTFYMDEEFYHKRVQYSGREMSLLEAIILDQKKVRVVPEGLTPDEQRKAFSTICDMAMTVAREGPDFHVSADEAHEYVSAEHDITDEVTRMLTGGRKYGCEWAFCTQRPAKLHEDAYTQMNFGVYFHLPKDNDRMKVNNSCGFDAYNRLEDLQEREAIVENSDTGETYEIQTDNLERKHPHVAGDDGIADDVIEGLAG